jgi:hypothetical protein
MTPEDAEALVEERAAEAAELLGRAQRTGLAHAAVRGVADAAVILANGWPAVPRSASAWRDEVEALEEVDEFQFVLLRDAQAIARAVKWYRREAAKRRREAELLYAEAKSLRAQAEALRSEALACPDTKAGQEEAAALEAEAEALESEAMECETEALRRLTWAQWLDEQADMLQLFADRVLAAAGRLVAVRGDFGVTYEPVHELVDRKEGLPHDGHFFTGA